MNNDSVKIYLSIAVFFFGFKKKRESVSMKISSLTNLGQDSKKINLQYSFISTTQGPTNTYHQMAVSNIFQTE